MKGFFATSTFRSRSFPESWIPYCGGCGLYRTCVSPKMPPYGKGRSRILVVGEAPGETEDQQGRPFVGKAGTFLREVLERNGVDMDRDCLTTNALICRPPKNQTPTPQQIGYCRPNLTRVLKEFKPHTILTLGRVALQSVLLPYWREVDNLERWVGWTIPLAAFWVCPTYHPAYLLRMNEPLLHRQFEEHLRKAFTLGRERPQIDTSNIRIVYDEKEVANLLQTIDQKGGWVAVDYETNCLKPEWPKRRIWSCAVSNGEITLSYLWTPQNRASTSELLFSDRTWKISSNLKMEERWTWQEFGKGVRAWGWDTMLAAHCLDNRPGICSLKFQALVRLGVPAYNEEVEPYLTSSKGPYNRISEIDRHTLLRYGGMDALLEWHLAKLQRKDMGIEPLVQRGYKLLHQGAVALSQVETNGIKIDAKRLRHTQGQLAKEISNLRQELTTDPLFRWWRKRFGTRANPSSRDQLGTILFEELGLTPTKFTEKGKPATDEEVLQDIDHPYVQKVLRYLKLEKTLGTFIKGIENELAPDGRIHPVFSLHTARTYRSSSDSPNFQNFPVRDKEISKMVRRLLVPSEGCVLVENDFKGIEVVVSAAYHKDPNFISYITSPGKDMHRDMAAQIYMLEPSQVTQDIRYGAKNKFVFPQFYGDFYLSCAKSLWEWIRKGRLKGPDGKSLYHHLKNQGIGELGACDSGQEPVPGTFEHHIRGVERDFWNQRFRTYGQWRKEWFLRYQRNGYFDLLSGFRVYGVFPRNAVVNYPIQGSAFHCLLWSLIQVCKGLRQRKMKSKVVGQIHDSLIAEVPLEELTEYLLLVEEITMQRLPRHFTWLVVSPEIEYEICLPGTSWFDKIPFQFKQGRFRFEDPAVFAALGLNPHE